MPPVLTPAPTAFYRPIVREDARKDSARKGAIIGAIVGASTFAILRGFCDGYECEPRVVWAGIGAGVGGLLGWFIGDAIGYRRVTAPSTLTPDAARSPDPRW